MYKFCRAIITHSLFLIVFFLLSSFSFGQVNKTEKKTSFVKHLSFFTGMGISMTASPSLTEYIENDVPYISKDSVKTFKVGLEFFGGLEYDLSKDVSLKLDYSYFIKSQTYNYSYFTYDYFCYIHQPYIMGFYVLRGNNTAFKFGAGLGYHFAQLSRNIGAGSDLKYDANGFAYRGEIIFAAAISNRLVSYISGFATGNSLGVLKDASGNSLKNSQTGEDVNLSGFGVGARLGFSIILY